jgi:hypothetical protein
MTKTTKTTTTATRAPAKDSKPTPVALRKADPNYITL